MHLCEHVLVRHLPEHVPKHVLKHLPKHVLRNVLEHVPLSRLLEPPSLTSTPGYDSLGRGKCGGRFLGGRGRGRLGKVTCRLICCRHLANVKMDCPYETLHRLKHTSDPKKAIFQDLCLKKTLYNIVKCAIFNRIIFTKKIVLALDNIQILKFFCPIFLLQEIKMFGKQGGFKVC